MTRAEYQEGPCRDCGEPNCPEVYYRNSLQYLCDKCRNKRGNQYIKELEKENSNLRKIISDAPHAPDCIFLNMSSGKCNCFKSIK